MEEKIEIKLSKELKDELDNLMKLKSFNNYDDLINWIVKLYLEAREHIEEDLS